MKITLKNGENISHAITRYKYEIRVNLLKQKPYFLT